MIISSLVIKYNKNIANFILRGAVKKRDAKTRNEVKQLLKYLHGHVIICGYGRVGQNIARIIEQANTPFVAFDLDPKRVADAYAAGDKVFYADATQYEILKAARVQRAKAVVISVRSSLATKKILQQIRHHHKQIPVIVRCYDDIEAEQLYDLGATEVIADTSELSLVLATHLLALLRVPIKKVRQLILHVRKSHYDLLHWVFPQQTGLHLEKSEEMPEGLHTVTLTIKSHAVNKQLKEINLTSLGVRVIRIRRKHQVILEPTHSTILNENDNLVLYGPLSNLEKAEKFILEG